MIAIIENDQIKGYNIAVGGGLSTTHGNAETYARLATVIGFVDTEEKALKAIYEVVTIQRDYGNRSDRKLARLKYTLDKMGVDQFKKELETRTGFALEEARPFRFTKRADYYGWEQSQQGLWYYTLFVENGRVLDDEKLAMKTALLEIARTGKANFRFTCNQNMIISDIQPADKEAIQEILEKYHLIDYTDGTSVIRKNAMACVAFNTCPLALAEGQRYMPTLLGKIEPLLAKYNLEDEDIIMRMTGCPNGCARPYAAEVGFVGTAYGKYNMHLQGDYEGTRLNKIYRENLDEAAILSEMDMLLGSFKQERNTGERFGDFTLRKGWAKS
jgi:sulfite reductase (NADPH) hemoprotein beta-component